MGSDPYINTERNEYQSINKKMRNANKLIRLANATTGPEKEVHIKKLEKLIDKYGLPSLA